MSSAYAIATPDRSARIDRLESSTFDVVVIGGGITGAGVAREAALRGLSVALLEAEDFAAGTSSRSSKLIHGGLRYLALGDVALVRETARERKCVHALAPHLAEPCWMLLPARSRAGLMKFRTALGAYEKLGAVAPADCHSNWFESELSENEPLLDRSQHPCASTYREYLTDDARLVIANLRAAAGHGAEVVSYLRVDEILRQSGRVSGVVARCGMSGRRVRVCGRAVVNASGPWVEGVRALDEPGAPPLLHLSRGIHVVVRAERLPVRNHIILGTEDRRSIFAIPRGDCVYLGTTDTSHPRGAELWPRIEVEDVEYLCDPVRRYFDTDPITPDDCVAAWAGLRPLIAQPGKQAREISRRDEIWLAASGLISVAGGKLTGYRKMASSVMEKVGDVLGRRFGPPPEEDEPLPGGDFAGEVSVLAVRLAAASGIGEACARRLARLYGCEAEAVASRDADPLVPGGRVLCGEVDWAVECEGAETLIDVVYRRTRSALYEPEECQRILEPAAWRMRAALGWSAERAVEEIATVRDRMAKDLAFKSVRSECDE